jgi:hypothetical protein
LLLLLSRYPAGEISKSTADGKPVHMLQQPLLVEEISNAAALAHHCSYLMPPGEISKSTADGKPVLMLLQPLLVEEISNAAALPHHCSCIMPAGEISKSTADGKPVGPDRVWPGGLAMSRTIGDPMAPQVGGGAGFFVAV